MGVQVPPGPQYRCCYENRSFGIYREKGVKSVYVSTNKEPRRVARLVYSNGESRGMSYAKYLYTSYYECDVHAGDEVDHINGDQMDDRIENLQVISKRQNNSKKKSCKTFIELVCPVCGERFVFPKKNLGTHPNPCCGRRCGGVKSHWPK